MIRLLYFPFSEKFGCYTFFSGKFKCPNSIYLTRENWEFQSPIFQFSIGQTYIFEPPQNPIKPPKYKDSKFHLSLRLLSKWLSQSQMPFTTLIFNFPIAISIHSVRLWVSHPRSSGKLLPSNPVSFLIQCCYLHGLTVFSLSFVKQIV